MAADWDVRAARRIRARMRAWSIDLVHAHDARSHALAMIALLGRTALPLVVTRRVPFSPRSVRLKYGPRVTRFIAISHAVKNAMVEGGIDESRISVVHSGIAARTEPVTPRDWRTELHWEADSILCGIVGAMTPEKGLDSLDSIGSFLPAEIRHRTKVLLLGGGPGSAGNRGGMEIHAAGFVSDIDPAVAGLDMLWHPSRAEGLGTAVIDAMSLAVPPVAFAVGGLPEVIENEVSGLLVSPGDTRAFAAAAARLSADPGLRSRLGRGAKARSAHFDALEMTKGTEAVYNEVLSG
jgi:glycosyltransferase involved in cell wall biosynthesis